MKIEFTETKSERFLNLINKAIELSEHKILNTHKRKELIHFAYNQSPVLSDEEIKFIYGLENPENVKLINSKDFDSNNFFLKIPTTFLMKTEKGAIITIDERKPFYGGTGKFVCDHTARITSAFRQSGNFENLKLTGFIHIAESPDYNQFIEVIGMGINKIYSQMNQKDLKIMLTGFTKFRKVENNATSDFLFGDGTTNTFESFGFKEQSQEAKDRLDQVIFYSLKDFINPENIKTENTKTGRKYYFTDNADDKSIEIILVRLPVDTEIKRTNYKKSLEINYQEFMNDLADNPFGDRVQFILNHTVNETRPDVIISFGVHSQLPENIYEIETEFYGLSPKYSKGIRPRYLLNLGIGKNNGLAEIYKSFLN